MHETTHTPPGPPPPYPSLPAPPPNSGPWQRPPPAPRTSEAAVASLVCGVAAYLLAFVAPVVLAIVAVILGHVALVAIGRSGGGIKGRGFAIAGLLLGYLNLALYIVVVLVLIFRSS